MLFYGLIIVLMLESFLEFVISSLIQLKDLSFSKISSYFTYSGESIGFLASLVTLVSFILIFRLFLLSL